MKPLILLLLLSTAIGCASTREEADDDTASSRESATLCIENATAGYGNVVARASNQRFDVRPGETVCQEMFEYGPSVPVTAETRGGGVRGTLEFRTTFDPFQSSCWHWRLSNDGFSNDLRPCR